MTTDKLEQIRDALDDLAGFVNERYAGYPETDRRFARDFAVVTRAREALRSLEAAPQPVGAEEGDTPAEILCSRLIDAWCDTNGGQIPWDKAIEITAITTKLPDAERLRLLTMDDDGAPVPADRQVADLSAFVKHLAHQLRKAAPDNDLAGRAVDYLKREGLQGSPMRIAAPPFALSNGGEG